MRETDVLSMGDDPATEKPKRRCVSCGHNIRKQEPDEQHVVCRCELDGHYIGYVECFERWCPHWKRDRKWEEKDDSVRS